jgi:hypothetical protein
MGAKLSVLPGTGETDPEGFERMTLGTTPASLAIIGCQLVVRRHGGGGAPSARARFRRRSNYAQGGITTPLTQRGGTVKNGVATCQIWP